MFWERFFLRDVCGRDPPPVARHRGARPLWTDPGLAGCGPGRPPHGQTWAWQMILAANPRRKRKRRSNNHHRNNLKGPLFFGGISWLGVVCPTPFNDGRRAGCSPGMPTAPTPQGTLLAAAVLRTPSHPRELPRQASPAGPRPRPKPQAAPELCFRARALRLQVRRGAPASRAGEG